ncbi:MAG: hypothetical protein ACSLFQ_08340 [Thermoanaerobaculia bacterium]
MPLSAHLAYVSPLLLLLLLCAAGVAFAILGLSLVRRFVPAETLKHQHEIAGFVFGVLGAAFGVLLGFAVLQVWEQWSRAEEWSAAEEGIAESIHRHIRNYPNVEKTRPLLAQFERYVRSVVDVEYPAMAKLQMEEITDQEFQLVWERAGELRPESLTEQGCFTNLFSLLGQLAMQRELRLESARGEVPAPIWYALLVGGFGTVAFSWLFAAEKFSMQAVIVSALAIALTLPLYVVILLNHPFAGSVRIEPAGYRELLRSIAADRAAIEQAIPPVSPGR